MSEEEKQYDGMFVLRYRREYDLAPSIEYLIDGVLPQGGTVMLYGESGCGKSYLALSWGLHIQSGRAWGRHAVKQATVLFIGPEGHGGLIRRQMAWEVSSVGIGAGKVEMATLERAVDLGDPKSVRLLLGALLAQNYLPDLIIIDTLQRAVPGKDVSSSKEISAALAQLDWFRAQLWERDKTRSQPTVLLIHHTRRSDNEFIGSQAIKGWLDAMLCLTANAKGDVVTLECDKMRDDEIFEKMDMGFEAVVVRTPKGMKGERALLPPPEDLVERLSLRSEASTRTRAKEDKFEEDIALVGRILSGGPMRSTEFLTKSGYTKGSKWNTLLNHLIKSSLLVVEDVVGDKRGAMYRWIGDIVYDEKVSTIGSGRVGSPKGGPDPTSDPILSTLGSIQKLGLDPTDPFRPNHISRPVNQSTVGSLLGDATSSTIPPIDHNIAEADTPHTPGLREALNGTERDRLARRAP